MELGRVDAPCLARRREADAVFTPAPPDVVAGVSRDARKVRVDEIEALALGDPVEEPQRATVLDTIPAHVRHLESRRKAMHHAGDHVEAAPLAELLASGEQQLVAQADAEKRPAPVQRTAQRLEPAPTPQARPPLRGPPPTGAD